MKSLLTLTVYTGIAGAICGGGLLLSRMVIDRILKYDRKQGRFIVPRDNAHITVNVYNNDSLDSDKESDN